MRSLPRLATYALIALLVLDTACASHGPATSAPRASRDEITYEQLQQNHFTDVFEAVQSLHSNWLQTRGTDSFQNPTQVQVYIDDTRVGGVESLRGLATSAVGFVQHLDGISATARWGLNHGAGAIYVSSRRRAASPQPTPNR